MAIKNNYGFDKNELAIFRTLASPEKIQRFLDYEIDYNKEKDGETCRSPRRVLRDGLAHCAEGAYFAAAALRVHGFPPLIVDLVAVRDYSHYYNLKGELTLREFSRPVNLARFDRINWMTTEEGLWAIGEYLYTVSHSKVLTSVIERKRRMLDRRLFEAGLLGAAH
jgi:hypothetical protein